MPKMCFKNKHLKIVFYYLMHHMNCECIEKYHLISFCENIKFTEVSGTKMNYTAKTWIFCFYF